METTEATEAAWGELVCFSRRRCPCRLCVRVCVRVCECERSRRPVETPLQEDDSKPLCPERTRVRFHCTSKRCGFSLIAHRRGRGCRVCRDVFIEKHYRGVMPRTICETFWQHVTKAPTPADVSPVIATPKCYLIHIQRNRLFFLAVVQLETPPLLVLEFLNRIGEVFVDYFGELSEEKLREHFAIVYCVRISTHVCAPVRARVLPRSVHESVGI